MNAHPPKLASSGARDAPVGYGLLSDYSDVKD